MKKKLALLFLLVTIIPILLAILLSSNLVSDRMEGLLRRKASDSLQVAENVFAKLVEENSLKARIMAGLGDLTTAVAAKDQMELIQKLSSIRQDLSIHAYDGVVEIYQRPKQLLTMEPRRQAPMADTKAVASAFADIFKTSIQFRNQQLEISSCVPLHHTSVSTPLAALCIAFAVSDKLADEIKQISNTETFLFVPDPNTGHHAVLATSLRLNGERYQPQLAYPYTPQQKELVIGQTAFLVETSRQQADNREFFLAVAIEKTALVATVASLRTMLYFIGLVALLVALLMALLFSARELIQPIQQLVRGAESIGAGNLDTELKIRSKDELAILAATLNTMRLKIRGMFGEVQAANQLLDRKVFKLSAMNQINQAIITHSGQHLLSEILKIITDSLQADRSSIMLLDHKSYQLLIKIIYIQGEQIPKPQQYISLEKGEGIAGYVVQSGQSIISNHPEQDPKFKRYESDALNAGLQNLLCVPLRGEDSVLGVINVDNKPGGFSEEDCELLEYIARQVAIAIQNMELYEQSITDGMTQLFIHRYFQAMLATELKRAERYKLTVSLLMFDIDHFKKFNDTYGHQVGDQVIQQVAGILRQNLREGIDIPARYGGEEFAVIMPGTDVAGAYLVAERLRQHIESSALVYGGQSLKITISLGCAEFPTHAGSKDELIARADTALYRSKEKGRNQTTQYQEEWPN